MGATVKLYVNTDNQIKKMKEQDMKSNYIDEWEDVLVESIHGDLAQIWFYLAGILNLILVHCLINILCT